MLFWTQGITSQTPCVSVAGDLEGLGGIGQPQIQETLFHTMVPEKDCEFMSAVDNKPINGY